MTLFTFENTQPDAGRRWFGLLGVGVFTSRRFWLNLPVMLAVGIATAFLFQSSDQLAIGLASGFLIVASSFVHGLGHILSSRSVGGPMTALILTATVNIINFDDKTNPGSRVHVGRSLGGPLLNLVVGAVLLIVGLASDGPYLLLFTGALNVVFGVFTLMPIPTLDGAVIFKELRYWNAGSTPPESN